MGFRCEQCDGVWTVVCVDPSAAVEVPGECGCPTCWADMQAVLIYSVGGSTLWLPEQSAPFRKEGAD